MKAIEKWAIGKSRAGDDAARLADTVGEDGGETARVCDAAHRKAVADRDDEHGSGDEPVGEAAFCAVIQDSRLTRVCGAE